MSRNGIIQDEDVSTMKKTKASAKKIKGIVISLSIPVVYYLILMVLMPDRVTFANIRYYLAQAVLPAVLAWGASFSLTVGHRDFSIGASVLASAIIGGNLALRLGWGPIGMLIMCPLVGFAVSSITGGLFVLLRIPSMIVSIGMMLIIESVCGIVFDGAGVLMPSEYVIFAGSGKTLLVGLVVYTAVYLLYNRTTFGYHVRAIGSNASVAETYGLKVLKTRFWCFAFSGLFSGVYAALMLGTTSVQRSVSTMGTMKTAFDGMMCFCVGLAVAKSVNPITSIFIGSIYMQLVQFTLTLVNFPSTFTQAIIAVFVLAVMCNSGRQEIKQMRKAHKEAFLAAEAKSLDAKKIESVKA